VQLFNRKGLTKGDSDPEGSPVTLQNGSQARINTEKGDFEEEEEEEDEEEKCATLSSDAEARSDGGDDRGGRSDDDVRDGKMRWAPNRKVNSRACFRQYYGNAWKSYWDAAGVLHSSFRNGR